MTRTERIRLVLNAELDRQQGAIDGDDCLREITMTIKVNDGGVPRLVALQRSSQRDLTANPR